MIGLDVIIDNRFYRVTDAADAATARNLNHIAAIVRKSAIESIEISDEPSELGEPPHTRGERRLPRSIQFDVGEDAVIGPSYAVVGLSAAAHEFGEEFKGQDFDERPFMLPALMDNLDRFHESWRGSIGD